MFRAGFTKIVSGVLIGATLLASIPSAEAAPRYRYHRQYARHHGFNGGNALVIGAIGALAVGAIIASQHRSAPDYTDYTDYADQPGYYPQQRQVYYSQPQYYQQQQPAYYAPYQHHHRPVLWDSERRALGWRR